MLAEWHAPDLIPRVVLERELEGRFSGRGRSYRLPRSGPNRRVTAGAFACGNHLTSILKLRNSR